MQPRSVTMYIIISVLLPQSSVLSDDGTFDNVSVLVDSCEGKSMGQVTAGLMGMEVTPAAAYALVIALAGA